MMTSALRIGIDLGGTGTRIALVTPEGDAVDHVAFATSTDPARAVPDLVEAVRRIASDRPFASIGIGASGPVDSDGVIRNPETLPAFTKLVGPRPEGMLARPPENERLMPTERK